MRFLISILVVALLSAVAEYFFPWWSCAVVCFAAGLATKRGSGKAFLVGFIGVGLMWLLVTLYHDLPNEHILSIRMAGIFKLPDYRLFIAVTVFVGALVGGLSAWAGSGLQPART